MRLLPIVFLLFLAGPAVAAEIACEGPFAVDSSEARLIEVYGKENVVTEMADGPEASELLKTFVFKGDPEREFEVVWWNEEKRTDPSYFTVPDGDTAPGGLRAGMSIEEVEALNGEPFTLAGFGWDNGGGAEFSSGKLSDLPGGCILTLYFWKTAETPDGVDPAPITGDVEVRSDLPLMRAVKPQLDQILFGYPYPGFR